MLQSVTCTSWEPHIRYMFGVFCDTEFISYEFCFAQLVLPFVDVFMLCLDRFVIPCICLKISCTQQFALIRFRFFWSCWLFFCIPLAYTHAFLTAHSLLYPNSSKCPSPNTISIVTTFLVFFTTCMLDKTSPSHPFGALFP